LWFARDHRSAADENQCLRLTNQKIYESVESFFCLAFIASHTLDKLSPQLHVLWRCLKAVIGWPVAQRNYEVDILRADHVLDQLHIDASLAIGRNQCVPKDS